MAAKHQAAVIPANAGISMPLSGDDVAEEK